MNEQKAREILGNRIQPNNDLYDGSEWVDWQTSSPSIQLDSAFSADELEAMAWWMRNKAK